MLASEFVLQRKWSAARVGGRKFPEKVDFSRLTGGPDGGIMFILLEAGLHRIGVRSTYILGLQIGLNFVPATKTET
jgi:hypothetical protein